MRDVPLKESGGGPEKDSEFKVGGDDNNSEFREGRGPCFSEFRVGGGGQIEFKFRRGRLIMTIW